MVLFNIPIEFTARWCYSSHAMKKQQSFRVGLEILSCPRQGEIHSLEPAFSRHPAAAPVASTIDSGPWSEAPGPRGLQASAQSDGSSDTINRESRDGNPPSPPERRGLGSTAGRHRRSRLAEESGSYTQKLVHVAYRHSDLHSGRSRQQSEDGDRVGGGVSSPSASPSAAARAAENRATAEGAKRHRDNASKLRAQTNVAGTTQATNTGEEKEEEQEQDDQAGGQQDGAAGDGSPRKASRSFGMHDTVTQGVGWTWDGGPFGAWPESPSTPKVLQIGIAMDVGYFKVCAHWRAWLEQASLLINSQETD